MAITGAEVQRHLTAAGADARTALDLTRVAWRESGWKPDAHRTTVDPTLLRGDLGLFQINYTNDTDAAKRAVGYSTRRDWFDPAVNARMAMYLVTSNRARGGDGYDPWRAGPGGFDKLGVWSYGVPSEESVRKAIADGTTPSGGKIDPDAGDRTDEGEDPSLAEKVIGAALGPLGSRFGAAVGGIEAVYKLIITFFRTILSPDWWRRVGVAVLGVVIVGIALFLVK